MATGKITAPFTAKTRRTQRKIFNRQEIDFFEFL